MSTSPHVSSEYRRNNGYKYHLPPSFIVYYAIYAACRPLFP